MTNRWFGPSATISRRAAIAGFGAGALGLAAMRRSQALRTSAAPARRTVLPEAIPATAGEGALGELLGLAPNPLPGGLTAPGQLALFADIAAQIASVGVTAPVDQDDPAFGAWSRAIGGLALPQEMFNALTPDWRQTFGWDGFQIDRGLELGQPPSTVALYQGRFVPDEIRSALEANGYGPVDIPGTMLALSLSPEPDIDLGSLVGRLALAGLNNVAILENGTLVGSGTLRAVEAVAAVARGQAESFGAQPEVRSLLASQATPLVSAILLPGIALAGGFDPAAIVGLDPSTPGAFDALATAVASAEAGRGQMPPIRLALIGTTAGGPIPPPPDPAATPEALPAGAPDARARFSLLLGSRSAAEQAVPVIEDRLATGASLRVQRPWSDIFDGWTVSVAEGEPVVVVELETGGDLSLWADLYWSRDLGFLAW